MVSAITSQFAALTEVTARFVVVALPANTSPACMLIVGFVVPTTKYPEVVAFPLTLRFELNVEEAYTKIPAEVLVGAKVLVKICWKAPFPYSVTFKTPLVMDSPVPVISVM